MNKEYLYDIVLDGKIVGDQGDYSFDTREEAQADADSYISALKQEYEKKHQDFEVQIYEITK